MRLRPARPILVVSVLALASCGAPEDLEATLASPAETPQEVVSQLVAHLAVPDFEAAGDLALPGQAALASLSEGASFADVAEALRRGDTAVAASFWAGFAQASEPFLSGQLEIGAASTETREGVEFHLLLVRSDSGGERVLVMREEDGFRIDLFASFGAGLAERLVSPVERLLTTQTEDSRLILRHLKDQVPSLMQATTEEGISPDAVQRLLRLIELITRVQ